MTRYRREARYLGLAWCIVCSAAATIGGIVGIIGWISAERQP